VPATRRIDGSVLAGTRQNDVCDNRYRRAQNYPAVECVDRPAAPLGD
jgi:hypothetical protein